MLRSRLSSRPACASPNPLRLSGGEKSSLNRNDYQLPCVITTQATHSIQAWTKYPHFARPTCTLPSEHVADHLIVHMHGVLHISNMNASCIIDQVSLSLLRTTRNILISLGTRRSTAENFRCTWEHLGAPMTSLGAPMTSLGAPVTSLRAPRTTVEQSGKTSSLGAQLVRLEIIAATYCSTII